MFLIYRYHNQSFTPKSFEDLQTNLLKKIVAKDTSYSSFQPKEENLKVSEFISQLKNNRYKAIFEELQSEINELKKKIYFWKKYIILYQN